LRLDFALHLGEITCNRLQQVGRGQNALEPAILVDDDRHLCRGSLKEVESPENRSGLVHDQRLLKRGLDVDRLAGEVEVEEVLLADDAGHLVNRAATDKEARVLTGTKLLDNRIRPVGQIDPGDAMAGRHDRSYRSVGKMQHALDHLALGGLDHATLGALHDQIPDLFLCDHSLARRLDSDQAQNGFRHMESIRECFGYRAAYVGGSHAPFSRHAPSRAETLAAMIEGLTGINSRRAST
jgi:hypothetical protein